MTEHRAVPTATAAPDADLVVAARTGDQHAFAAIYDRYADRVFSLCVTLTRDRGIAEDAMADTFLVAWQRLDQLRDPDRLRAWLFAIARNRVTRLGARAGRETPTDTMADGIDPATTTATDAVAETVVERVDADADAAVVWEAASALNPNERALLELSVRQGLDGLDLAAALGMTRHHVNVVAGRMRTNLEQGVAALDLLRREPGRCPALDDLVAGFDGVFTPAWRKRIARHARSCPTCGDQRSRTPVAAFGAVPLLLAPVSARAEILDSLPTSATGAPVVDHSSFRADRHGFPARPTRRAPLLVVVGALVVLVVGWPLLPADDADSSLATPLTSDATSTAAPPSDPSTAPPTTAATTTTGPDADPDEASSDVTGPGPARPDPGRTTIPAPSNSAPPISPSTGSGTTTTTTTTTSTTTTAPDVTPPTITGVTMNPTSLSPSGCPTGPYTATVTVTTADDRGAVTGRVTASVSGVDTTYTLSGNGTLTATIGPFTSTGSLLVTVDWVRDAAGNTSASGSPTGGAISC